MTEYDYVLTFTPRGRAQRRHTFEKNDDGTYTRVEWVRDHADEWRDVGSEVVGSVSAQTPE